MSVHLHYQYETMRLTIEASMRTWQPVFVAVISMDIEPTEPIHTLELSKTIKRDLAGTGDELKKLGPFFFVKGADRTPEPLNLRRGGLIIVIFSMIFPIININVR